MQRAPRICGCGHRIASGSACPCEARRARAVDRARGTARERGYTTKWQRESAAFLARPENRLCACGCGRAADMVDHRTAHRGDPALFWDRKNWRSFRRGCNSRKAAREEGGFGNPRRAAP